MCFTFFFFLKKKKKQLFSFFFKIFLLFFDFFFTFFYTFFTFTLLLLHFDFCFYFLFYFSSFPFSSFPFSPFPFLSFPFLSFPFPFLHFYFPLFLAVRLMGYQFGRTLVSLCSLFPIARQHSLSKLTFRERGDAPSGARFLCSGFGWSCRFTWALPASLLFYVYQLERCLASARLAGRDRAAPLAHEVVGSLWSL